MYQPEFHITPHLLSLIAEASCLRTWIENAHLKVSWLPVVQKESKVKQAHFSTSIEGNPLTYHQVKAVARGEEVGGLQKHKKEVTNYLRAVHWIEKQAGSSINEKMVLQLHKILMQGLLPETKCGKYKKKQNYVMNEKRVKVYTPPSPKATPKFIKELLTWLNSIGNKKLHTVLACAILHHRLVSIHPFSDGNGRIARALSSFLLFQHGFDLHYIFSLDEFFAHDRDRYYQKIQHARELDDNLTHWIEYVAEGIVKTLKEVKKRIEDLQVSTQVDIVLTKKQEELLRILRDEPTVMVAELKQKMNVSRARVNQIIVPLIKSGLVVKQGQSKATRYYLQWKT